MTLLGFVAAMIPIMTTLLKLNSSIVKLNTTMATLTDQQAESKEEHKGIHTQLNDHETRITVLERK